MFQMADKAPIDQNYASQRIRNEPLVELTQGRHIGNSSAAVTRRRVGNFEIMPYRIATTLYSEPKGSYAREALLNGLTLQDQGLPNAYQFGFIGASDTHNAASSLAEETYFQLV